MANCEAVDIQALARLRAKGGMSTNAADSRLSRCSAAREATRSSRTAQEPEHELLRLNRQYTSYRCRFTGHSSSIGHSRTMDGAASWTLLPAHPPRSYEEVWRWVLARALAVCGAALARLRALPPMMIMMNDVGCASVRTHPGGAIRSTREAGICELSKLAEGS